MAYKINIRNQANNAWVNLLEAQYLEVADSGGYFTGATVEAILAELFEGKATRVEAASDPGASDDSYQTGTVWVNTATDTVHICVDDASGAAVWLNVSSIDLEGIQDVVGGMFTGNSETNVTSTYNDTTGKVDLSVATATNTVLGVASFPATDFVVTAGAVTIAEDAITAVHLADNIDMSSAGFNADQVDGTDVNDSGITTSDLWTASKIKGYVDATATGLSWQEPVISIGLDDPPGSPVAGDRYVVSAGTPPATGDWLGQDNDIAEWDGSAWVFTTVEEGFALWDQTEDVQQVFNGTSWAKIGTTITHSNLLGLQGGNGGSELYHLTNAEHGAVTGSKAANTFFAAPDGAAGVGGFRAMVANDVPTLLSTKISDFTEASQDAFGAAVAAGTQTNITVTYDDANNKVDYSVAAATTSSLGVASFATGNFNVVAGAVSIKTATSSQLGVASFDATDFTVTGGAVTINDAAIDHGSISGLADDDHTQYMHISTDRTVTAQHTFAPASAQAPFVLGANAQGELVTGLNADLLNGQDWTVAATASAPAAPATNDVWIELTA